MTSKFQGKLSFMRMRIEDHSLRGGKAELRSSTLSDYREIENWGSLVQIAHLELRLSKVMVLKFQ